MQRLLNLLQPVVASIQSRAGAGGSPGLATPPTPTGAQAFRDGGSLPPGTVVDDDEPAMEEDTEDLFNELDSCAKEFEEMAAHQKPEGNLEQGQSLLAKAAKTRDYLKRRTSSGVAGVKKAAFKAKPVGNGGAAAAAGADAQSS